MNIESVPILATNYKAGRGGVKPDVIVIHVSEGTTASLVSWFQSPAAQVSSHYGISPTGEVMRFVDEDSTAWHAGTVVRPTAAIVKERAGKNPNSYSIGIENAGFSTEEPPESQIASLVELVVDIAKRHSIPLTRRHVIGHREIRADKTCPGKIDVAEVVRRAVDYAKLLEGGADGVVARALDEIAKQSNIIRRARII